MRRDAVPPYLIPGDQRIDGPTWTVTTGGKRVDGPEPVAGWDYQTVLNVHCALHIDLQGVVEDCELGPQDTIGLVLRWRSTTTNVRGSSRSIEVADDRPAVTAEIPGHNIGGRLVLDATLALLTTSATAGDLAPTRPGSILWNQPHTVVLEGDSDRFPVELKSFSLLGLQGGGAAWVLRWDTTDLEWAAGAALRLWLNSDHPAVKRYLGDPDTDESRQLMSVLSWDISRQMIEHALDSPEFTTLDWPEESLGASLATRLAIMFPGMRPAECRVLRREQPADFESAIQTGTRLLTDS